MKGKGNRDNVRVERLGMMTAVVAVTALLIIAQTALGVTLWGASGIGRTSVDASGCDAYVSAVLPAVLDVSSGDTVTIWYNYSWGDSRTYWSPTANHTFHMDVTYQSTTQSHDRTEPTNGNTGGSRNVPVSVQNVQERTYIWMNWTASITSSSPLCYDFDSKGGPLYLS